MLIFLHFSRSTIFVFFCTFRIQSENHQKRFWHASTKRKTQPRRRNQQTAAMQRGLEEVGKKRCPRHSALRLRIRTAQCQKIKARDARHRAQVVQKAFCSASKHKNCKTSFVSLFPSPFLFSNPNKNCKYAKDHKDESHCCRVAS